VKRVSVPRTTHTLELAQLADLNQRLSELGSRITASELGLAGAKSLASRSDGELPGSAALLRLAWDGPPAYPYIHAQFAGAGQQEVRIVDLHTAALKELGRRLGVRQQWGA
jgi:hypothetical protein